MDTFFTTSFRNKAVPGHTWTLLSSSGISLFSLPCLMAGTSHLSPLSVLLVLSVTMAGSSSLQCAPALLAEMSDPVFPADTS